MRRLSLPFLTLALMFPAGTAAAQVKISGGGVEISLPKIKIGSPSQHTGHGHRGHGRRSPHRHHEHSHPHRGPRVVVRPRHEAPRGYWKTIEERVWVPPVHEYRRDACGRYYQVCVRPGYWTCVTRRVWVSC